jgi:ribonuclease HII
LTGRCFNAFALIANLGVSIIICGGDEAGRGAIVGPLVISLVSVKNSNVHRFSEAGVRDSKMLTDKKRRMLYNEIGKIAADVRVDKISPGEINDAMRNGISLNELEAVHFARLFDTINEDISEVYLDSPDVVAEKFGIRFNMSSGKPTRVIGTKTATKKEGARRIKVISEHKADSRYPVVSAASIIAKVSRDKEIKKLERELGIELGSGYPSDNKTINAIKSNMKNLELHNHIREYWQTMDHIKQTRLTNF